MQRFKQLLMRLIPFVNRNIYTAIFLLASFLIIYASVTEEHNQIYKTSKNNITDMHDEVTFMYATGKEKYSKVKNGKSEYTIYVNDAGTVLEYRTNKHTVDSFLSENGIEVGKFDEIMPFGNAALADKMTVIITRVDYITEDISIVIPYKTVTNDVDTVMKGTTEIAQTGKDGMRVDTVSKKYVNGVATGEESIVSSVITEEPVDCIKEHGIGGKFTAPDGKVYKYLYRRRCVATAYYDKYNRGKTATGHATVPGIVAVDKKVIPLHSNVYVCGDIGDFGILKAEDVGNFRGNWIDIFFETKKECYAFGRQKMDVYVLETNACDKKIHTVSATTDIGYKGADWRYTRNLTEGE